MDNLTHSLFGLTLARTPLGRAGRGTTTALFLASNAPDVDIVVTAGGAANYLEFHRGPTHGPLGVVGLACVVAAVVWFGRRRWDARTFVTDGNAAPGAASPAASFGHLWAISIVGILCHVLMDLPTSYGTRPLSPFTWTWFAFDWMPIIDIYLLAILGAGLWFGNRRKDDPARTFHRQRNARVALLLMAMNYGVRATAHFSAIERAPDVFGERLPEWCADAVRPSRTIDRWPRAQTPISVTARSATDGREAGTLSNGASAPGGPGRCLIEVAATPSFVSPFRWQLIAHTTGAYEIRDVDLLALNGSREPAGRQSVRVPNQWTPSVLAAAQAPIAQVFLGFSRFPAARSVLASDGTVVVRWSDMRFVQGAVDESRQLRRGLFGATVILASDGRVLEQRLGP